MKSKLYIGQDKKIWLLIICLIAFFLMIEFFLTAIGVNDVCPAINKVLFVVIGFTIIFYAKKEQKIDALEVVIMLMGYCIRLSMMYVSIHFSNMLSMPYHHTGDDDNFYRYTLQWMANQDSWISSYYCIFLATLFIFFGKNRVVATTVNILCYILSSLILVTLSKKCKVDKKIMRVGIILFSIMPVYILLSSALLRESIILFFILLANSFFILWMHENKRIYLIGAFLALVPPTILHSGTVVLAAVMLIMLSFYDSRKKELFFNKKLFLLSIVLFSLCIICFKLFPDLRHLLHYIPNDMEVILALIDRYGTQVAGANYLSNLHPQDFGDLIKYLPIKMIYFQFSPMPGDWRGITDMLAFFIDGGFYMITLGFLLYGWLRKRDGVAFFICMEMIAFQVMFAWGVMNAGTAMRHRCKLLGIAVFGLMYVVNRIYAEKNVT